MKKDYRTGCGKLCTMLQPKNETKHEILKGGKLMKTKNKLVSGLILAIATIALGTSVHAVEFTSRILQSNQLRLGEISRDFRLGSASKTTTSSEFDGYASKFTQDPNLTVPLTRGEVIGMHNFFCIEPTVELPTDKVNYVADGQIRNIESKKGSSVKADIENSINSYIISSKDELEGDAGKDFFQKVVQSAIWKSSLTESDKSSKIGEELYETAKAYAEYIKRYKNPELYSSTTQTRMLETGEYIVGPYKLSYTTAHYNNNQFGEITGITIKDSMGNVLTRGTDWELTDSTGKTKITEIEYVDTQSYIEGYNFPKSGQEFYIRIRAGLEASSVNMTAKFNTIDATGHYIKLKGSREVAGGSSTTYCDECKELLKGTIYKANNGDIYSVTTNNKRVGVCSGYNYYNKNEGYNGAPLPSEISEERTEVRCNGTNNVRVVIRRNYATGEAPVTDTVKCGDKYTYIEITTDGRVLNSSKTARCMKAVNRAVKTYRKIGCGTPVTREYEYTVYSKTDGTKRFESVSNIPCGTTRTWERHETKTQELIYAWGERTTAETEVEANIILETVDLSLRKFITGINNEEIKDRIPQVDVTPLKNGETTAKYNHTKSVVSAKIGDKVTYTIRVYNEGTTDAFAKEVKDYLPVNMEFVTATVDGVDYGWKASTVNGRTVITTSYLADKKLEKYHTINETDYRANGLDYKDLKLIARIKSTTPYNEKLVNIAEISKYAYVDSKGNKVDIPTDVDSKANDIKLPSKEQWPEYQGAGVDGNYVKGQEDDDDFERLVVNQYVDLSLRKFITAVNNVEVTSRTPQVDVSPLKNGETTAKYNHTKAVLDVAYGDEVTYTIRVYNEGNADGYALEVKDYLPVEMEFVSGTVNGVDYGWKAAEVNGRTVITTNYLQNKKIDKFDGGDTLDYEDLKLICKVKNTAKVNEILLNISEISKYGVDVEGKAYILTADRDSTADNINLPQDSTWPSYYGSGEDGNYVKGQEDDDDFERVSVRITDIAGTVWLDVKTGKQQTRNDILDEGEDSEDKRLEGIKVELYMKDDSGEFKLNETKNTDKDGNYRFENKPIGREYTIKFEYKGQQYMPVASVDPYSKEYTEKRSIATETSEDRYALNNKFHEIVNGKAKNREGNDTIELRYDKDENAHKSTLIRDEAFNKETLIKANTVRFNGADSFVNHINLGLYERAQADLGIMTDVQDATLTINGLEEVRNYNGRSEDAAMNVEVKLSDLYNKVYDVDLFKSDYNFRISDYNQEDTVEVPVQSKELEVYITYKIKVQNYSTEKAGLSELKMYYAPEYNLVDSWYSEAEKVSWIAGEMQDGYKTMTTNLENDIALDSGKSAYVYVKFQVAKNENGEIALGEKYAVTEITGYTTEEGLIDINSEPGNVSVNEYQKTFEDDTDKAPGINVYVGDQTRTMTGFVWEDLEDTAVTEANNGVKMGDGLFNNNSEQKQNGVTVQLIELVEINGQTYEYIWQEAITGSDKVKYMDRTGTLKDGKNARSVMPQSGGFTFTDYVPGRYIVRFIYGENLNKDKEIILSGQEYRSTTYKGYGNNSSSAKDNKVRRLELMTTKANETWMNADTVDVMTIGVAEANHATSVNFGLIKRPIAKLIITKEIESVKITNNGMSIVDTEEGNNAGVRMIDGSKWTIELDDETINGAVFEAKYKITVTNDSEKDTLYSYFEGEKLEGLPENQDVEIKTAAKLIYDKPQHIGFSAQGNEGWTRLANSDEVILATEQLGKFLARGESISMPITLNKILSEGEGSSNLETVNIAVLEKGEDGTGRPVESDEAETTITITDPTGVARTHYEIWIAVAVILVVGIVAIKMLVLKKK